MEAGGGSGSGGNGGGGGGGGSEGKQQPLPQEERSESEKKTKRRSTVSKRRCVFPISVFNTFALLKGHIDLRIDTCFVFFLFWIFTFHFQNEHHANGQEPR